MGVNAPLERGRGVQRGRLFTNGRDFDGAEAERQWLNVKLVDAMDDETFAWCLFQEADTDGSGGLDREEIRVLSRNLGNPL